MEFATLVWLFVLNALLGLALIEWSWFKVRQIREQNAELDNAHYAFKRLDIKGWSQNRFRAGAATILVPRILFIIAMFVVVGSIVKLLTLGVKFSEEHPIQGWRGKACKFLIRKGIIIFNLLALGTTTEIRDIDYDYSYYLGKDYKATQQVPKHVPTVICNHQNIFDSFMLLRHMPLAIAAKNNTRKAPLIGNILRALDCVFIKRTGTLEVRNKQVDIIKDRQKTVLETGKYAPLCIFPEGGTTNGSHMIHFKRGAFESLLPMTPCLMRYTYGMFRPSFDVIQFVPQMMFQLSQLKYHCEIKVLPPFVPNEYLYKTHADKVASTGGRVESWEVFAWAVRDVMSAAGGIPKSEDQTQALRLSYMAKTGSKSQDKYRKD